MIVLLVRLCAAGGTIENFGQAFEESNRLYEQGKFVEAAQGYQQIIESGRVSADVYFNLGNAWFKAGQHGRAVAAYRQAERIEPRDPNIQFNLQFVREKISGDERDHRGRWERFFGRLTINEWTMIAASFYWLLCLALVGREVQPAWRGALRPYAIGTGVATLVFGACLAAASHLRAQANDAVVIVPNAVVRRGPLQEAPVSFQLPDGSEVTVIDRKELILGEGKQQWLQVQDRRGTGWLQRDQVILLKPAERVVEPRGVEPLTFSLRTRRSTN